MRPVINVPLLGACYGQTLKAAKDQLRLPIHEPILMVLVIFPSSSNSFYAYEGFWPLEVRLGFRSYTRVSKMRRRSAQEDPQLGASCSGLIYTLSASPSCHDRPVPGRPRVCGQTSHQKGTASRREQPNV